MFLVYRMSRGLPAKILFFRSYLPSHVAPQLVVLWKLFLRETV